MKFVNDGIVIVIRERSSSFVYCPPLIKLGVLESNLIPKVLMNLSFFSHKVKQMSLVCKGSS